MTNFNPSYMKNLWSQNRITLMKTGTYFLMHITVAMIVAYAITRNFWMSLSLSLIEPAVQAFAFFFHEKIWTKKISAFNQAQVEKPHKPNHHEKSSHLTSDKSHGNEIGAC